VGKAKKQFCLQNNIVHHYWYGVYRTEQNTNGSFNKADEDYEICQTLKADQYSMLSVCLIVAFREEASLCL
jgi:hypothetical protein